MNQSMMKKEERNPKMTRMTKVKMSVKTMRMETKMRTKEKVLPKAWAACME
jgi:hypothetical protein